MEIVRTCTECGTQDTSHVWPSVDKAAAAAGAIEFTWACPSCAGPEFELAERSLDDSVASGSVSGSEPYAPTDPREARRTLGPPDRWTLQKISFKGVEFLGQDSKSDFNKMVTALGLNVSDVSMAAAVTPPSS